MAKLVSMKMSKTDLAKRAEPSTIATDAPMYPWGLSVNLDDDSLEKLEIDVGDMKVGDYKVLIAKVEVTSLSSNESKGGGNQSATLQIMEMCLEDGDDTARVAKSLYKE